MKNSFGIPKQVSGTSVLILIGVILMMGFIQACVPPPVPLPVSRWNERYAYNYDPPQKMSPASVRVNVIVVDPFYRESESVLSEKQFSKVGKGFSKSMGVDLDKIIVAKGMTAIGPYQTLDDVTYPDKKNSNITLAPRVFITSDTKFPEQAYIQYYNGVGHWVKPFTMKISGWLSFEMREPLSGQKMWVKKLEMEEVDVKGIDVFEAVAVRKDHYGNVLQWGEGQVRYNGREEALANVIKDYYSVIMEKAWIYLNTQEILDLKDKTREIRERKVY